jgi:hypothetical protein
MLSDLKQQPELYQAFMMLKKILRYWCLLSAEGPSSKDGVYSFVVVEIKARASRRICGRRWTTSLKY